MNKTDFTNELNRVSDSFSDCDNKMNCHVDCYINAVYKLQIKTEAEKQVAGKADMLYINSTDLGLMENVKSESFVKEREENGYSIFSGKVSATGSFEFIVTKELAEQEVTRLIKLFPCGNLKKTDIKGDFILTDIEDRELQKEFTYKSVEQSDEFDLLSAIAVHDTPVLPKVETNKEKMSSRYKLASELTKNNAKPSNDFDFER